MVPTLDRTVGAATALENRAARPKIVEYCILKGFEVLKLEEDSESVEVWKREYEVR